MEDAIRLVNDATPGNLTTNPSNWPICEALLPHTQALHSLAKSVSSKNLARLLNQMGLYLHTRAQFAAVEPLYRRAVEIGEKTFGPEHPDVAIRLNKLALLLQDTNRLPEAEPLMRRALEISEKTFGAEHPTVAICLNNLAQLLQATNRLLKAEPLMRRALDIFEKSLGGGVSNDANGGSEFAIVVSGNGGRSNVKQDS